MVGNHSFFIVCSHVNQHIWNRQLLVHEKKHFWHFSLLRILYYCVCVRAPEHVCICIYTVFNHIIHSFHLPKFSWSKVVHVIYESIYFETYTKMCTKYFSLSALTSLMPFLYTWQVIHTVWRLYGNITVGFCSWE